MKDGAVMSKRCKYRLAISTFNLDPIYVNITKTKYDSLKKHYTDAVTKNNSEIEENSEFWVYLTTDTYDHETYVEHSICISDGGTYIRLIKLECKDGYVFTR